MIPMDTVKTRLVTQAGSKVYSYNGILDCFTRMIREEGIGSFYNSLTPRLVSVVPMIGVQYFVYEASNERKLMQVVLVFQCGDGFARTLPKMHPLHVHAGIS